MLIQFVAIKLESTQDYFKGRNKKDLDIFESNLDALFLKAGLEFKRIINNEYTLWIDHSEDYFHIETSPFGFLIRGYKGIYKIANHTKHVWKWLLYKQDIDLFVPLEESALTVLSAELTGRLEGYYDMLYEHYDILYDTMPECQKLDVDYNS